MMPSDSRPDSPPVSSHPARRIESSAFNDIFEDKRMPSQRNHSPTIPKMTGTFCGIFFKSYYELRI